MSELTATQIPRPRDEQAFERCMEILWRCILKDENANSPLKKALLTGFSLDGET